MILASASPRRQELLQELVGALVICPSPLAEPRDRPEAVSARGWAEALAYFKARSVADSRPGEWVLGADTIVAVAERLLGKPADEAEAREMLVAQAGRPSDVITGVALVRAEPGLVRRVIASDCTRVWMRDDADERERYLAGGDWQGKAGAYGIQDVGDVLVERFEGSFSNVVGLPVELVRFLLGRRMPARTTAIPEVT